MRVLVIGSGGREHALAWRLSADPEVTSLVVSPGNPGISTICRCVPVDALNPDAVLALAEQEQVDLTVVGPEAPLERGLADRFRAAGRPIVGPGSKGAQLECSKAFAKDVMRRQGIPTARFELAESAEAAAEIVASGRFGFPLVLKADGLAAGKGVVIAATAEEASEAIRAAMVDRVFGASGARLVIEECLVGPEVSVFYLCDGQRAIQLSSAEDHKRIFDGDRGPNTGGMGAIAPSPRLTPALAAQTMREIVNPVLEGMRALGEPFIGFLYVSLMLTADGPKVIEFNVRFGDPEAQVVLPQLDGPFAQTLLAAAEGRLAEGQITVSPDKLAGVVLAARGYPGTVETGQPIDGLERAASCRGVTVFHAGTAFRDGRVVTAGGRVLTVVGRGASFDEAIDTAYRGAAEVHFDGMQFRRDIGHKVAEQPRPRRGGPVSQGDH